MTRLHSSEYFHMFTTQAAIFKTVYLVIDALNICQSISRENTWKDLRRALGNLPSTVRVLVTFRDSMNPVDSSLSEIGGGGKELLVTPTEQDLATYVRRRIEQDNALSTILADAEDRRHVVDEVTAMAFSSQM